MISLIITAFVVLWSGPAAVPTTTPPGGPVPAPAPIPMEQSAYFPASTQSPQGIGESAIFNSLAVYCQAGAMDACGDLYSETPYDSEYEAYAESCGGRQPGDVDCDDLLINALATKPYTLTSTMVQPGTYFRDALVPGIYLSGPISGEASCYWEARDEWGYATNSRFVSADGLGQAIAAMLILPIDSSVEIGDECGPMTLIEAWMR